MALSVGIAAALAGEQSRTAAEQLDRRASLVARAAAHEIGRYGDALQLVAAAAGEIGPLTAPRFADATRPLSRMGLAGATSIAFLVPVVDADVRAAQARWRARGVPELVLQPASSSPEHIFSVFSVPLDGATTSRTGIDASQSAEATRALLTARRTSGVAISAPYQLILDRRLPPAQRQQSFVLTAPVTAAGTDGERSFQGWVVMGLRGQDFTGAALSNAAQGVVEVTVRAPNADGTDTVVARSRAAPPSHDALSRLIPITVVDQQWHLEVSAERRNLIGVTSALPIVTAGAGITSGLLLACLIHVLATRRERAQQQVAEATAELAAAEAAARGQADLLTTILDNISDGIGVVNADGEVILRNPAAKAIFGTIELTGGRTPLAQVYEADGQTPVSPGDLPVNRSLAGVSIDRRELVIRMAGRADDVRICVTSRPLRLPGDLPGAVYVYRDVTAQRRDDARLAAAAADVAAARDAVTAQKDYLTQILDALDVNVIAIDTTGAVVHANQAARPAAGSPGAGRTAQSILGTFKPTNLDGTPIPFEDSVAFRALKGEANDGREAVLPAGPEDGRRVVMIHGRPLRDPGGVVIGAVLATYDITALREREAELHAFAQVVAHDLQAPLSAVSGYTELLEEELTHDASPTVVGHYADRIGAGIRRMSRLIDDLLAYATARDAALCPQQIDLRALVDEVITERVAHLRGGNGRNGETPLRPDVHVGHLPEVLADLVMTRQLFDNLIGNALKYTLPGQPACLDISAHTSHDLPGWVQLRLADRGIGIPADDQAHVFTQFHRAAAHTSRYAGTGLGLAICHRVVTRHGGTITVADNPGGGTLFTFTLPAAGPTASLTEDIPHEGRAGHPPQRV